MRASTVPSALDHGTAWPHPQRGAALLMALIIVSLVATLATSMVWQQWRAVQVEAAERSRAQSSWILAGALDWARIIIRADANPQNRSQKLIDHLGEPWAVPLAEARLSTFLAVDDSHADEAPDTFLSGRIEDAQSRYNLFNLIDDDSRNPGKKIVNSGQLRMLAALCANVDVSSSVALLIANGLQEAMTTQVQTHPDPSSKEVPLKPARLEDLAWLGVDGPTLKRLEPFIWIPPDGRATVVNANTAPREVLAAVIPGIDLGAAERLVQVRTRTPFESLDEVSKVLPNVSMQGLKLDVKTEYFLVSGQVRLAGRILEQRSLVRRTLNPLQVKALSRESFNSADPG